GCQDLELIRREEAEIVRVERAGKTGQAGAERENTEFHSQPVTAECSEGSFIVAHCIQGPSVRTVRYAPYEKHRKDGHHHHDCRVEQTAAAGRKRCRYSGQAAGPAAPGNVLDDLQYAKLET